MANEKIAKFIIDVSAEKKRTQMSDMRFFSTDHKTAKIVVQAEKDGEMIAKTSISRVEIMLESSNARYQPKGKVIFNDQMTVDDDGLFSYVLPDELLNYSGLMTFEVYIYYTNGDVSDSSNRIVYEQRVSAIDRNAGQVELVYIKDMEQAKQAVQDKADEVMADMSGYESSLANYEHQIKADMDQLYDSVANVSADEITKIRAELPKVETAANDEITKIQAVLPDVQTTAADETAKIKAQLPIVEAAAVAETEKIQAELPKVQSVTADETTKIQSELPHVQTVAIDEIGKIHSVLPTVEQTAQEVSDHADQKIAEYDAKFVSTDQKMAELEQSQGELDAELKVTQQQIADADVYTKAETDARNLSPAWSWSADGKDRFTRVKPQPNMVSLQDDYDNAVPRYIGWSLKDSNSPSDYKWEPNPERKPWTAYAQGLNGEGFSLMPYGENLIPNSGTLTTVAATIDGSISSDTFNGHTVREVIWNWGAIKFFPTNFTKPIVAGVSYIYSCWFRIKNSDFSGSVAAELEFYGKYTDSDDVILKDRLTYSDGWVRLFRTFKYTETTTDNPIRIEPNITGSGAVLQYSEPKLELANTMGIPTPWTPAPSEDPLNAYPKYKGLRLAPSDNPADYDWSYTDEYVDYLKSSSVSKTEFNDLAARLAALENKEV